MLTQKQIDALDAGRKLVSYVWDDARREKARQSRLNSTSIPRGDKHHMWSGDNVSYRSLHRWISRYLGKPKECARCRKVVEGRGIHWDNISKTYKRDLSDWIRLCARCHAYIDGRGKKNAIL